MNFRQYDEETLKHLHDLELMILKEFIKICEENNLNYYMYAGSLLGTIRHKGFIPWDDDLDVIMFREDFEKFKKIFPTLNNPKYDLLSNEINEDYFFFFAKLMLRNTKFEEKWNEELNLHVGINIDIFVLDDMSNNKFSRKIQIWRAFFYNPLLVSSALKLDNSPFYKKFISHMLYYILKLFNLNTSKLMKKSLRFLKKYSNKNSEYVFDISAMLNEYPLLFRKSDFGKGEKVDF